MNKEFNGTVGVYIRVSTLEQAQEGYSIKAQKERLTSYCQAQGWTNVKFYVDEGISARNMKRPQLNLLMQHVEEQKVNLILVYRLDRLTRSVRDLHKILEVTDEYNCGFRSATEIYDTTSAMGRLFITIVAALAEWESANSSERIKMMLEKKVSDGERVGNIPYGFTLNEHEYLDINPRESAVILSMIEDLKSGLSVNAIAQKLRRFGNNDRSWSATAVFRILRNVALYGATQWNADIYEDTHEPIISKEEYDLIQSIMRSRKKVRRPHIESNYIFQGVIKCHECKATMSVNRYRRKLVDGTYRKSAVYRCNPCSKKKKMNTPSETAFLNALFDYMKNFKLKKQDIKPVKDDKLELYRNELSKIENMRAKYQRAWATDLIEDDEFTKLMDETLHDYIEAKRKVDEHEPPTPINADDIKDLVLSFKTNFEALTIDERRTFIATFIKEIHYDLIPQPPKNPRNKAGRPKVVITDIIFR